MEPSFQKSRRPTRQTQQLFLAEALALLYNEVTLSIRPADLSRFITSPCPITQ